MSGNYLFNKVLTSGKSYPPPVKFLLSVVLYAVSCWLAARFVLRGWGDPAIYGKVMILAILFVFLCASKKTYWSIVFPLTILACLYGPIASVYGQPDYQSLISAFCTNGNETWEFLALIPAKVYFKSLRCLVFGYVAYRIAQYCSLRPWKNKTLVIVSVAILVIVCQPTQFFSHLASGLYITQQEIEALNKYGRESTWGHSTLLKKENKDYVLIIGESARRDYFQIYGYPVKDTPFLASTPGTIVQGLTSGDTFTVGSLRLMLTQANTDNWTPRYDRNIVDLANSAGMDTIWLSNQGFIGEHDTPISAIAYHAHTTKFPSNDNYEVASLSDFVLLPRFQEILNHNYNGSRFFVLHTIGSHPDACKRIFDLPDRYLSTDPKYNYIACYLSSIKKTDRFIEKTINILKDHEKISGRPFSLIYFSDHGLVRNDLSDQEVVLSNNQVSYFHYDIPLVKIDSDSKDHQFLQSKKSALRFTEGLASWMGIQNSNLHPYDLFDGISDPSDYGFQERRKKRNPIMDRAIDMTDYLKK